jgi:hypothetical protein
MSESNYLSSLRRETLRTFFDASPTARLLRSDHAPFVIDFLNRVFKLSGVISLGQLELRSQLANYQEELHATEPSLMVGPAEQYLTKWSEAGWLQRFFEAASVEPQYQLTRHAEEAIRFVDSVLSRSNAMVGTESRLRLVIETLEDIVRGASADPARRLDYLREQRTLIDEEIAAIESGKSVQVYRPAQIRERFQTAIELLKALQSDFRAVEERFQMITRDVQQQHSSGDRSRGGILGYALDAEDLLKQQDEGISFFAFVAFLFSPTQQAALRKHIEEVQHLAALADQRESLSRVKRMVPALLAEADKVMKTTARLSATLRRLLDAQAAEHRVRLASVLRDIRQAVLQLKGDVPSTATLSVVGDCQLASPFARTFWRTSTNFEAVALAQSMVDLTHAKELFDSFRRLRRLDYSALRQSIREATLLGQSIALPDLLNANPNLSTGIVDLLGLLQIACDDGHDVDGLASDVVRLRDQHQRLLEVRVPRVVYHPKAKSGPGSVKPK